MTRFGNPYWQPAGWRTQSVNGNPYRCLSPNNVYSLKTSKDNIWRFETRQGDCLSYEADRTRSEIVDIVHPSLAHGGTFWCAFDFKVSVTPAPLAPALSGGWLLVGQLHPTAGSGDTPGASPIFSFNMQPSGELALCTNGSTENPLVNVHSSVTRAVTGGFSQNVWHRSVVRFSLETSAGSIAWWLDGVKLADLSGIQLGYASDLGPYWQFGIYTGPVGVPMNVVAEYANVMPPATADLTGLIGVAAPEGSG
jgi:hypothetical protein